MGQPLVLLRRIVKDNQFAHSVSRRGSHEKPKSNSEASAYQLCEGQSHTFFANDFARAAVGRGLGQTSGTPSVGKSRRRDFFSFPVRSDGLAWLRPASNRNRFKIAVFLDKGERVKSVTLDIV